MAALWNILGRHIYGKSDEKENQIKEIFRKHRDLIDLENKILRNFSDGKKVKMAAKDEQVKITVDKSRQLTHKEPKTPGKRGADLRSSVLNPQIIRQASIRGNNQGLIFPQKKESTLLKRRNLTFG
jgi:hypothetical protein